MSELTDLALGELPAIDLPDGSVDWIWSAFLFHEVEPPDQLQGLRTADVLHLCPQAGRWTGNAGRLPRHTGTGVCGPVGAVARDGGGGHASHRAAGLKSEGFVRVVRLW